MESRLLVGCFMIDIMANRQRLDSAALFAAVNPNCMQCLPLGCHQVLILNTHDHQ
jgi:hypothetical protein